MGQLRNFITPLHKKAQRDYIGRMNDDKVACMGVAKEYEKDYWDGDRRYGYGGYRYMPGRWEPVARDLIATYNLTNDSKVLDVGCGKAYLLYEIKKLLPGITIVGFDISKHGLADAKEEVRDKLILHRAQDHYNFADNEFDLVMSITTVYNLEMEDLVSALKEIERVGKNKYVVVESYRNNKELFNLQCWALTCESFFSAKSWVWVFNHFGYTGDYEFIYFE